MSFLALADNSSLAGSVEKQTQQIEDLGYTFQDIEFLASALTHRSWCAEFGGTSNERLEFLGDAVLGLVVTQNIYLSNPDIPEGQLAKIRSAVVSSKALAEIAEQIGVGQALCLGKGEESSGGRSKSSILADALEAIIGAIYLDGGISSATEVIERLFKDAIIEASMDPGIHDYKTRLQEFSAQHFGVAPTYQVEAKGPDHDREFSALAQIEDQTFGPGAGTSKKEAEQEAARIACQVLIPETNINR
ncbi:MAG: Ribonuclease 3 [Acidimicrobiales bacterium AG-410-I20]|nr:MAG: Ribonuclease 3 [Acidimicrobiales bacterium AG-410-I20]